MLFETPNRFRFLYLVRHGQYVASEAHPHGELTELGRLQARRVGELLSEIPLDAVWSSTMSRAEETAALLREAHGSAPEVRRARLLRERIFPGHDWYDDPDFADRRSGAERLDQIYGRWMRPSRSERHEVLVCHGNLIRAIVTRLTDRPLEAWWRMPLFHGSVTRVGIFGHDEVALLSFNEHLFQPRELQSAR